MSESLEIVEGTKAEKYAALLPQIKSVIEDEPDIVANMANVASMIHETFGFWWTGFYRVDEQGCETYKAGEFLVLGPFQGPLACTRIKRGRGVCGTAFATGETQVVPDVDKFPGHIACSSASRSEIVVPMKKDGKVVGVLDIDSAELATFDEVDKEWLEKVVEILS